MESILIVMSPTELARILNKRQTHFILNSYPKYTSTPFTAYLYCRQEETHNDYLLDTCDGYEDDGVELFGKRFWTSGEAYASDKDAEEIIECSYAVNCEVVAKCVISSIHIPTVQNNKNYEYHITELEVFNVSRPLDKFESYQVTGRYPTGSTIKNWMPIKRISKSWMYVREGK